MKNLNLNLDKTLSSNSNIVLSSQRALKSYIDDKRILLDFLQDTTPTTYTTGNKWLNTSNFKLYIATSSSAWDNGTNISTGQIFSYDNLLYYYDGTNLLVYSTKSIVDVNSGDETKIWIGTQNEYDNLSSYDPNTIYNITDNSQTLSTLLATAQEYADEVQNKAATPYQVLQSLDGYLPKSGGTLNAGATLSFKNTNNGTNTLSFDNNNVLNITNNLSVSNNITANNIIATSGNIYKTSTSGETVVWSNTLNNYLPLSGGTLTNTSNQLKIANTTYASNLGTFIFDASGQYLRLYNQTTGSTKPILFFDYLSNTTLVKGSKLKNYSANTEGTILDSTDKAVANGLATLDANAKVVSTQIPYATASTVGGIKVSFDSSTGTLNIVVE